MIYSLIRFVIILYLGRHISMREGGRSIFSISFTATCILRDGIGIVQNLFFHNSRNTFLFYMSARQNTFSACARTQGMKSRKQSSVIIYSNLKISIFIWSFIFIFIISGMAVQYNIIEICLLLWFLDLDLISD